MLERFRARLSSVDALPQLAVLGLISGLLVAGIIIVFRLTIEYSQAAFLPGGDVENYEALSAPLRFALPAVGGLLIGLIFQYLGGGVQVGVVHVLERLSYHQGQLPLRNALYQFFGAALSIICGHSVGREGPGIHLGAAGGSLLGSALRLPNNSIQTLLACGTAASIAASFNTPIAGVVFAMEVILMEYTIAGFTPVILASVSATAVTQYVFGTEPAFSVPSLQLSSLLELPYFLILGLTMGSLAAGFIALLEKTTTWGQRFPLWQRMGLAGVLMGLFGLVVPQVMGIGYDTVNEAMLGQIGLGLLLIIVVAKGLATTLGLGLGLPGGLIGPTLVIGAAAGGLLGLLADTLFPGHVASPGFYAMLGMGAMMSATLQAPLAALMALLELTANPNIILPGMLAVVLSSMVASHLFGHDSVFLTLLRARGLDYQNTPLAQFLRRVGVTSAMNTAFVSSAREVNVAKAEGLLHDNPLWIVITDEDEKPVALLLAADLARYLSANEEETELDLLSIPAQRENAVAVNEQSTLQEALNLMNEHGVEALYVKNSYRDRIVGIITRQTIESHYY
jgi:CIC family chloride channel protein